MRSRLLISAGVLALSAGSTAFRLGAVAPVARRSLFQSVAAAPAVLIAAKPSRGASSISANADDLASKIKETVSASKVVVYSKSWCPFCQKTKMLFDSMGVPYTAVELDQLDDGDAIQATLLDLTKQRTVPNVFINGEHLGGNDDTQKAAKSGKLAELLK